MSKLGNRRRTSRRVSIKDIAAFVGVHQSTVSLALRNDSRLKEETRQRIQKAAVELGYVPDPKLKSLMSYLSSSNKEDYQETVVMLSWDGSDSDLSKEFPDFTKVRSSLIKELKSLGYKLERILLSDYEHRYARLSDALYNRNIRGIIIPPSDRIRKLSGLRWKHFAAVSFGTKLAIPNLHKVVPDQVETIRIALEQLTNRGYKRPILARGLGEIEYWDITYKGWIQTHPSMRDYPIFKGKADREFINWFRASGADSIIVSDPVFISVLRERGYRFPRDLGLIALGGRCEFEGISAVSQRPTMLGHIAANHLVRALERNELGIPDEPLFFHTAPRWVEGSTLSPLGGSGMLGSEIAYIQTIENACGL